MVPFKRSAAQLIVPSTPMMLGGPPMDISPWIYPHPYSLELFLEKLLTLLGNHRFQEQEFIEFVLSRDM